MLALGGDMAYRAMKITMFKDCPPGYEDDSAMETYMDFPYEATRQDDLGTVKRAEFRYLGDAMKFVTCIIEHEVNPCLWRVKNQETDRLCARWRYSMGETKLEVKHECDDENGRNSE